MAHFSPLTEFIENAFNIVNAIPLPWLYAVVGATALGGLYLEYRITFLLRATGHRPLPGTQPVGYVLRLILVFCCTAFVWWTAMWLGLDDILPHPSGALETVRMWIRSIDWHSVFSG